MLEPIASWLWLEIGKQLAWHCPNVTKSTYLQIRHKNHSFVYLICISKEVTWKKMAGAVTCIHDLASRSFGMCMMLLLSILEMAVEYNITSPDVICNVCKKKKRRSSNCIDGLQLQYCHACDITFFSWLNVGQFHWT